MNHEQESLGRLERLSGSGAIDRARVLVDDDPPILRELGLTPDRARELLSTQPTQLESVGSQPSQLEAIVRALGRPPLMVVQGAVQGKHKLGADFPADIDGRITAVEPLLGSVGRVEFLNHDQSWGGTAWVVQRRDDHLLVVTNRHVARLVARRTARGDAVYMFAPGNVQYGAAVDFAEELGLDPDPRTVLAIDRFVYLADDIAADIAIGRIACPPAGSPLALQPLTLAEQDIAKDELVAVVGYPARDSLRNDPTLMERYFTGIYDVKRFSPGYLMAAEGPQILRHDCTTLGGNSGSPVISLCSGKVVGLHFAGRFGIGNSAVRASTIRAVLDSIPQGTSRTSTVVVLPLDPPPAAASLAGRPGYDPDFLQTHPVPLPQPGQHLPLAVPSDASAERPHELKYQNFGILFSVARRLPLLAAANIDARKRRPQKRHPQGWRRDGRIAADLQAGATDQGDPAVVAVPLVRPAAMAWGDDEETVALAFADGFHCPVACPWHLGLGPDNALWTGIEDHILTSPRTHGFRCVLFHGPILHEDDPRPEGAAAGIPMRYFKVVVMLAEIEGSGGELGLSASAYLLSQADLIQRLLQEQKVIESVEGFDFASYRTFQLRLCDLERISGFDFGALKAADPLAALVERGGAPGRPPRSVIELQSLDDIVL